MQLKIAFQQVNNLFCHSVDNVLLYLALLVSDFSSLSTFEALWWVSPIGLAQRLDRKLDGRCRISYGWCALYFDKTVLERSRLLLHPLRTSLYYCRAGGSKLGYLNSFLSWQGRLGWTSWILESSPSDTFPSKPLAIMKDDKWFLKKNSNRWW